METIYSGMMDSGLSGWCSYSVDNLVGTCLMDAKGKYHPRECHERISLGYDDTKDIHMLKAKLERGCRRAAAEGRVGRIAMSKPSTDFNSMILGAA
ncbi:hypothetical protein [uncultured Thalassospira sp.]|uniref:hypothetical protein n=1 Tax=uncultured Thalassospira sp. TaxID=404382 RepID=UPI00258AF5D1|nr:hypothetical protein [uncultured Thalassospira sp.]